MSDESPVHTFGVLFIGCILSMIGYGFTFFQTYVYFSQYPSDPQAIKIFVTVLFVLDTGVTALVSNSTYFYIVTSLPYTNGLVQIKSTFNVQLLLSQISVLAVQMFLSLRIWKLSRNIWATGLIINAGGLAFAFGIAMVALIFNNSLFAQFTAVTTRVVTSLALGFTMLASLLILLALTRYSTKLSTSRGSSGLERFDNICLYLLPRGLVGTALWLGCLFVFVLHPGKIYWVALYFIATKFSINGLLNLLISRQSFRGKGFYEEEPVTGHTKPRTGQSSTGPFTTVSAMFATNSAMTINISRTIEVEQGPGAGDPTLRKGGYDSDQMEEAIQTTGDKH